MRCESRYTSRIRAVLRLLLVASGLIGWQSLVAMGGPQEVQPTAMHGKVMCGYQGWFRCPGDAAGMGWIHWSYTPKRIAPETLCFEMWPEVSEYGPQERFIVPGFTHSNGAPAELFSSDNPAIVQRHFEWMRDYGTDGAWMQHFLVDLPGGLQPQRYASRRRVLAYAPWNVGNWTKDAKGEAHASTGWWAKDKEEFERRGGLWMPVVYPGFSWDNLQRKPPGTTLIPRRGGRFFWEQFHELSKLGVDCVYVAMFDEVDKGTAVFKVTSSPPVQGHFVGFEGLPSDGYLRLVGAAASRLRQRQPIPLEIPIKP